MRKRSIDYGDREDKEAEQEVDRNAKYRNKDRTRYK